MSQADQTVASLPLSDVASRSFWEGLFPQLTLCGKAARNVDPDGIAGLGPPLGLERLREEGYLQGRCPALEILVTPLARAVADCRRLNIPPAFIFLFDEAWACFEALDPWLRAVLGSQYRVLPDFWAWHIDPAVQESGWRPHRDKGRVALAADGAPLSLTAWIPLTEAMPQNGCMYLLPANRDPVYNTADEGQWRIEIARIRALPVEPGEFLMWNQAVLHWGGEASRFAAHARISAALEFQRGDIRPFNQPLSEPFANHGFETRLKLVAKQILQYRHMYPLAARFEALAQSLLAA